MRRYRQEITDQNEILEIITSAGIARLGINRDGAPYIVPMNFGYADGSFYFHCAGAGLKLRLLEADPRVCIELDESSGLRKGGNENPCDWGVDYRSLIAEGRAVFITGAEEKRSALNIIIRQFEHGELPPLNEESIRAVTVFRVTPDTLTAKHSG